jgi:Amt family ammonium transporter
VSGATYRKIPTVQFLLFIVIWTTIVYDPVARWNWHPQGWSRQNHSLDSAGGTVVHIISGAAVQAFAIWYGLKVWLIGKWSEEERQKKRFAQLDSSPPHNPHNIIFVVLGTMLMWLGWFGFNGGSLLGANTRAASAVMSTQIAASFGAVTGFAWYAIEKWIAGNSDHSKSATLYFCEGALNGLVAITPAAGYVPPEFAPVFGVVAATTIIGVETVIEFFKENVNSYRLDVLLMHYDVLHIGLVHAGSGFVGMFLTAFLNRPKIFELDGFSSAADYSQDATQLGHQLKDAVLAWLYSFFVTLALLCMSTGIKWLLFVIGGVEGPWKDERSLDVLTDHAWAAGEAQIASKEYELKFLPVNRSPSTTRNTTMVEHQYGLGDYPAANGVPSRSARREDSAREESS